MATPVKAKKSETAKQGTPYTTSRVTRLRTPKKSEDKRVEREKRKVEDAMLTRSGRKVQPRKQAKSKTSEQDEKNSEDEKHVKWDEHENLSSKEGSEISEGEEYDTPALVEDEKTETAGSPEEEEEDKAIEHTLKTEKASDTVVVKSESESEELPKAVSVKPPQSSNGLASHETIKTESQSVQTEKSKPAEPADEISLEAKKREDLIMQRYQQQWAAENERRQRISETEHTRRLRVAKKIDAELEKNMAEEYRQRDPKKASKAPTTTTSPLLPATYTIIKIEEDSDEEPTESASRESMITELQSKLESISKKLVEKDAYIFQLEDEKISMLGNDKKHGQHVAEVLLELEASSKEDKKSLEAEVVLLKAKITTLEDKIAGASDVDKTQLVQELAEQLEQAHKSVEEKGRLVDYANETLDAELLRLAQQKKEYVEKMEQWEREKDELEKKLREAEKIAKELQKEFKAAVQKGVKESILAIKKKRLEEKSLIVPFTGVPVSTYAQGQPAVHGLVEPPPTSYKHENVSQEEEVTETNTGLISAPTETQDENDHESEENGGNGDMHEEIGDDNGEGEHYEENGQEYEDENWNEYEENGEITGEEAEPHVEELATYDNKKKRPYDDVDDGFDDEVPERARSKIRRILGPALLGIPAFTAVAVAGIQIALDMGQSGF